MSNEPHAGPINDLHYMVLNNQKILLSASQDGKIRAFLLKEEGVLEKMLEHPV